MGILNKEVVNLHLRIWRLLEKYNEAYRAGDALVSDDVYDSLLRRKKQLEEIYPELVDGQTHLYNNKVGISPFLDIPSVKHPVPMLSLNNIFQQATGDQYVELREWLEKTNQLTGRELRYAVNYKFDGLALEVNVVDGEIMLLSTRGDGTTGNDVSHMGWLIRFPDLKPYQDTDNVYIRGEVVVMKDDLEKANTKRREMELRPYSNTRNTAAGLLRTALSNVGELEKNYQLGLIPDLYFIPHGGVCYNGGRYQQLTHLMGDMLDHPESISDDPDTIVALVSAILARRHTEKFDLDGAVISVFDQVARDDIEIARPSITAPNWAIAFKFLAEEAVSTLLSIDWQVGRSGELTPVANITPVSLSGAFVSRATLYNPAYIQQEGLQVGKLVGVKRSGDVIPVVFGIEETSEDAPSVALPTACPACGGGVVYSSVVDNKPRCVHGTRCPGARLASLSHVFGKKVLNVKGLGEAKLEELLNADPTLSVWGVYELPKEKIGAVYEVLHANKSINLATFIRALDLPTVGNTASKLIANNVRTVEGLLALCEVDSCVWLTDRLLEIIKAHKDTIEQGIAYAERVGFYIEPMRELNIHPNITGKTFCVTGSFVNCSRDQIKEIIQNHGGKVSGKVSANTAYLIVGDKPAASKIKDAKRHDIPIYANNVFDLTLFDSLQ